MKNVIFAILIILIFNSYRKIENKIFLLNITMKLLNIISIINTTIDTQNKCLFDITINMLIIFTIKWKNRIAW